MSLLPADTSRLPKWPFFVGDAALLGVAFVIGSYARNPFAGTPLILIVASVALGAVLAAVPFIADYARKQDEAFDERQRSLEALAHTVATSAEQISIAVSGLNGIAETVAKNLKLAGDLPARLQEKIGEIKPRPPEKETQELNALRSTESKRLETTADHIRQAAAELARLETVTQKNLSTVRGELDLKAEQVLSQLDAKITALAGFVEKLSIPPRPPAEDAPIRAPRRPKAEPPVEPESPPAVIMEEPAPKPVEPAGETISTPVTEPEKEAAPAEAAAEEAKPARKRAPKKPKPEEPTLGLDPEAASEIPATATTIDEFSQASPEEAAPATSISTDGATRLLVTAYIGIGNKLFIRGKGPGLDWDKGVPLQFVSIGKWRWETADATAPVQAKLYKNDDAECSVLGTLTLDPGQQTEVTATF